MGGYFSQETEDVEIYEYSSSPQICSQSFGNVFTFANDPRSPTYSRTPILVQESLTDPRSPGNDLVERTPLYDSNCTPNFSYKWDNKGYQPSPAMYGEEDQVGKYDVEYRKYLTISNEEGYQHSPVISTEQGVMCIDNCTVNNVTTDCEKNEETKTYSKLPEAYYLESRKGTQNNMRNVAPKSFLKTMLFTSYEELIDGDVNITSSKVVTLKKPPLGAGNDAYANGNLIGRSNKRVDNNKRFAVEMDNPNNNMLSRDKENMAQ